MCKEKETLCWSCTNFLCSWHHDCTPVNNWTAVAVEVKEYNTVVETYKVISCPLFIKHPKVNKLSENEIKPVKIMLQMQCLTEKFKRRITKNGLK